MSASRKVDGALVMYPVAVTPEFSLDDARRLLAGLTAAVEVATSAEVAARAREHVLIYGSTRTGMSLVNQSKLPLGPGEKPAGFAGLIGDEFWSACASPD